MEHIEAVKLVQKIERERPVMDIRYKGVSVWPFLRIYLADALSDTVRVQNVNNKTIRSVFKGLFFYGLLPLFKNNPIWVFTNIERRKALGHIKFHRVCGAIGELENERTLFWEKPGVDNEPCGKNERVEKNIISEAILLLLTNITKKCNNLKQIEGVGIVEDIIKDYNITFNYKERIKHLFAQYKAMKILIKCSPSPKVVFIESPFSEMGVVMALKESKIPVVELQHGVINEHHLGYNSPYASKDLYPDGICVYGQTEYNYLTKVQKKYCNEVYISGYYFIDKTNAFFNKDIFAEYRNKYKKIILISGQVPEERMYSFTEVLSESKDCLFVYVPRFSYNPSNDRENLIVKNGANIYECLKWCDIHVTMYSTTCLEAQFFCKPTIFYNVENLSKQYYGETLSEENGCYYIDTYEGFLNAKSLLERQSVVYKEMFAHDTLNNMRNIINKYL